MHNDFTADSGYRRARDELTARGFDHPDTLLPHRFSIINVWRPIAEPVQESPIAVCDARSIAGQDYQCSNASTCLEHSRKHSMVKTVYFLLDQQMCRLEDIKVDDAAGTLRARPLPKLLAESNQDLETFLSNLDSFSVGGH